MPRGSRVFVRVYSLWIDVCVCVYVCVSTMGCSDVNFAPYLSNNQIDQCLFNCVTSSVYLLRYATHATPSFTRRILRPSSSASHPNNCIGICHSISSPKTQRPERHWQEQQHRRHWCLVSFASARVVCRDRIYGSEYLCVYVYALLCFGCLCVGVCLGVQSTQWMVLSLYLVNVWLRACDWANIRHLNTHRQTEFWTALCSANRNKCAQTSTSQALPLPPPTPFLYLIQSALACAFIRPSIHPILSKCVLRDDHTANSKLYQPVGSAIWNGYYYYYYYKYSVVCLLRDKSSGDKPVLLCSRQPQKRPFIADGMNETNL